MLISILLAAAIHADTRFDLNLQVCDTASQLQQFTWIPVPSNLPNKKGETQLVAVANKNLKDCELLPAPNEGNATSCHVNVVAWKTNKGAQVWVTPGAPTEPVPKEENRIWIHESNGTVDLHSFCTRARCSIFRNVVLVLVMVLSISRAFASSRAF